MFERVLEPDPAKNFPRQNIDAACAEEIPHRHLERAGIGARNDCHFVTGRQGEEFFGLLYDGLEPRLAFLGAMRPANKCA